MVGSLSMEKWVQKITDFVSSGSFAMVILMTVALWTLVMLVILFWPQNFSNSAALMSSFKMWCFGYDPLTGQYNKPQLLMLVLDPLFIGGIVFVVWKQGISQLWNHHRKTLWRVGGVAVFLVFGTLASIAQVQAARLKEGQSIFDAQLVRTFDLAPVFKLTDQNGKEFSLPTSEGITIVSAFYTHCVHTCPQIIEQARRVLQKSKLDVTQLQIALITLDPENDSVDVLKKKAEKLELSDNWHLLTGESKEVNDILDQFQVARVKDAQGNIGHSNVFYVIDRNGKIAFRMGLGGNQELWLRQAIEFLKNEKNG